MDDRRVEIALNQLYGGQSKYALVEVEMPPAKPGVSMAVAEARCRYENVYNACAETASGRVEARFSGDRDEVVHGQPGCSRVRPATGWPRRRTGDRLTTTRSGVTRGCG
jgi:hypothetical protein